MKYTIEIELPGTFTGTEELAEALSGNHYWNFVAAFYPGYERSDEIAWEGDLNKLVDGEWEEGDCAHNLLMSEYGGDPDNPQIEIDWKEAHNEALMRAVEGFIDSIKSVKEITNG